MPDLITSRELSRLQEAMRSSLRSLEPFRKNRLSLMREYVGRNYSDDGANHASYVNIIELTFRILSRVLVSKNPQSLITTRLFNLKAQASDFELALNRRIQDLDIQTVMQKVVLDALFTMGIVKVGLRSDGVLDTGGEAMAIGNTFVDVVSLADWVHDMKARTWDEVWFEGNRYRLPLEEMVGNPRFNQEAVRRLSPNSDFNDFDDPQQRDSVLTEKSNENSGEGAFRDMVELWDVYIPHKNLLITIPADFGAAKGMVLQAIPWNGPKGGPFRKFSFGDVPGNTMGTSPGMYLRDMSELWNTIFNKLGRQAKRQKSILGYAGSAYDDANRVKASGDGETLRMDNPGDVQQFEFGGPNNMNLAFLLQLQPMQNRASGNLDVIGGLSSQADTLGQEQLLAATSSKQIDDMQDRAGRFATQIIKDIGFYLWNNPLADIPLVKKIRGTDVEIQTTFKAGALRGELPDFDMKIEPYSMQAKTPAMRAAQLEGILTRFITPNMQFIQAQGGQIDYAKLLSWFSKYYDMPGLEDIITFGGMPMAATNSQNAQPRQSPVTERTNIRINHSTAKQEGQDSQAIQQLLSGGKGAAGLQIPTP